MNEKDYDNDGNNIVPCPICLNVYCLSKEDGKCPEEDDFVKAHTDPYEAQGKIPIEKKYNKDGYLVEVKVNGHVIAIPEQHQQSVVILDENLKNTEWVKEKIYLTPEEAKARFPDIDPYLAQGKNFRVNHPVQPKTQVERWEEEMENNRKAIIDCCGIAKSNLFLLGYGEDTCPKSGTDKCGARGIKNQRLHYQISQATQPIHPRYATGTFADDKPPVFVTEKERTLLDKIKKLLQ